jgi:surfeit locus 1 family protein
LRRVFGIDFSDRKIRSAAVATAISLAILLSLGLWQIKRLHWKQHILDQIDHAEASPPVALDQDPAPFTKVVAGGILLPGTALYGAEVRTGKDGQPHMGAQRLQVLLRGDQVPLLVDLGWVPDGAAQPAPSTAPRDIMGYVRTADHAGALSAEDDRRGRHFYTLDPATIGPVLGVRHLAPFTLVAMGALAGKGDPVPATALPRPPNNHLQYAFTWFGLAVAMVGVFIAWARGRGREANAPVPRLAAPERVEPAMAEPKPATPDEPESPGEAA